MHKENVHLRLIVSLAAHIANVTLKMKVNLKIQVRVQVKVSFLPLLLYCTTATVR